MFDIADNQNNQDINKTSLKVFDNHILYFKNFKSVSISKTVKNIGTDIFIMKLLFKCSTLEKN